MKTRFLFGLAATLAILVTTGGARSAETSLTIFNDAKATATVTLYETTNYAPTTVDTMLKAGDRRTWTFGGASKSALLKIRTGVNHATCFVLTDGGSWTLTASGDTNCLLRRS